MVWIQLVVARAALEAREARRPRSHEESVSMMAEATLAKEAASANIKELSVVEKDTEAAWQEF